MITKFYPEIFSRALKMIFEKKVAFDLKCKYAILFCLNLY